MLVSSLIVRCAAVNWVYFLGSGRSLGLNPPIPDSWEPLCSLLLLGHRPDFPQQTLDPDRVRSHQVPLADLIPALAPSVEPFLEIPSGSFVRPAASSLGFLSQSDFQIHLLPELSCVVIFLLRIAVRPPGTFSKALETGTRTSLSGGCSLKPGIEKRSLNR